MARLIIERPRLHVLVNVVAPDKIAAELLSGKAEIGLGGMESQATHEALSIEALPPRRLYLACRVGHPLAGTRPSLAQVLRYPLVTVVLHGSTADTVPAGSAAEVADRPRNGVSPTIEVTSLDLARHIAARSDALFPGSASMLASDLACGQLVLLDFDAPQLRAQNALVRLRQRTPSPAAQRFLHLLREVEAGWIEA